MTAAATWLFVPGDRPERFDKAAAAGPDEVILDLEDAVPTGSKVAARRNVVTWLQGGGSGWVRLNDWTTPWFDDDLTAAAACRGLRGVVLPKAEEPDAISSVGARLAAGQKVVALIETARGVQNAAVIAGCATVHRLAFGAIDFSFDIDAHEADVPLLMARSSLVLASRSARLPPPIDGVTVTTTDPATAGDEARRVRALGFGGKMCIHPNQIAPVADAFEPSAAEVAWATAVLRGADTRNGGAVTVDGHMVDKPVVDRATRIIQRADRGSFGVP